jgi:TonB family protein
MIRCAMLAGLLLPMLLGGCSSRGPAADAGLEPPRRALDGLAGRRCVYASPTPVTLEQLTRPGTRGAILLWSRDATPGDTVRLSVRYGNEGRLSWVRIMDTSMSVDRATELRRLVESALEEEGQPDWGFRIEVIGSEVALLPSVLCRPEAVAQVGRAAPPLGTAYEQAEMLEAMRRPMDVVVSLDERGRVLGVQIRLSSGSRLLDQYAVDLARSYRYEPKLHDRLPVPSTIPLRLRAPRRF